MHGDSSRTSEEAKQALIRMRKAGIRFKILMKEGNTLLHFPINEYRWVPEKYFHYNLQVVYGNKLATCIFPKSSNEEMDKVLIIKSTPLTDSARATFNFMWENCYSPTYPAAPYFYKQNLKHRIGIYLCTQEPYLNSIS